MSRTKIKTAKKASGAKAKPAKADAVKAKSKAAAPKKATAKSSSKATPTSKKEKEVKKVVPKTTPASKKNKNEKNKPAVSKVKAPKEKEVKVKKADKSKEKKSAKAKEDGIALSKKKHDSPASKSKRGRKKKGSGDDDDEPMLDAVDDLLLKDILETVKPHKKGSKEPKQIRTFINPIASLTVAKDVQKKSAIKEPKGKFAVEYVLGTSPGILYEFLSTPSGLSEWFADDVNIRDGVFTFFWDGSEQKALLLDFKEEKYIRFQWVDKPEGSYFEFKIDIDDLTNDVSLIVTDFADEGSDLETSKRLWDSQIHTLMHVIGSY
jgi:uncharacterized protein YndB with AHSA1/START domain